MLSGVKTNQSIFDCTVSSDVRDSTGMFMATAPIGLKPGNGAAGTGAAVFAVELVSKKQKAS